MFKIFIISISLFITTSCGVDRSEYILGDNKYKIYSKGKTGFTSLEDIKKDWQEQAKKFCPTGYDVIKIENGYIPDAKSNPTNINDMIVKNSINFLAGPSLMMSGTIKCK